MNKQNEKIGVLEKLGFSFFAASVNVVYSFKNSYYKYFLTGILLINPIAASNIALIGTIWDILNDPLVGVWANNIDFKSGEKVRPWLFWSAFPYAIGMILIFTDFGVSEKWDIILAIVCFLFYELANTARGIPYNGMAALATADDKQRKSINSFRSVGMILGIAIGSISVPIIVKLFGGLKDHTVINSSDSSAIFKTALVLGILIVSGCLIHYFTTKERVRQTSDDHTKINFVEIYKILFSNRSWVLNMFFIMTYSIISALSTSALFYYCSYVMNDSSLITIIMSFYLLFSLITSVITPKIDSILGRKKTMILGALIQIIGKIPFIVNPLSLLCNIITVSTTGIGLSISFIMFSTNRNTISDIVELNSSRRLDTMVSTADFLASKIAEALVDKVYLSALAVAGFSAMLAEQGLMQNQATQNTIIAMLGWVPMLFTVIMLIIAIKFDLKKEYDDALAKNKINS